MPTPRTRKPPTVLVIEDDDHIRAFLSDLLTAEGYQVEATHSGAIGLDLARASHPDLITLDLGLPGKSGLQVLEELRANSDTRDIPVFVLTAYADLLQRWGRTQPDRCFTKPVDVEAYLSSLASTLQSQPAG
ncbi:MAG: response regulator [Chloroflexi bacterium]|nr:response regulator [Chloroflexota bacterium]